MRGMEGEYGGQSGLLIPIRKSDEFVELDVLPDDPEDVLEILRAELAPLEIWLKCAREYYAAQKVEDFLRILDEGAKAGMCNRPGEEGGNNEESLAKLLSSLTL